MLPKKENKRKVTGFKQIINIKPMDKKKKNEKFYQHLNKNIFFLFLIIGSSFLSCQQEEIENVIAESNVEECINSHPRKVRKQIEPDALPRVSFPETQS